MDTAAAGTAKDAEVTASWVARAAERSPSVQRSRTRVERAQQIVAAARRLAETRGSDFTTHELVKEAGIAVKTFYTHFDGKDQVLLAVLEELISEACANLEVAGQKLPDPITRLKFYITSIVSTISTGPTDGRPRFITSEHWRLHQLYPTELAQATGGFARLLLPEIQAATEAGQLRPANADYDSWLITQLIIVVFHHYEYAPHTESAGVIGDRLWAFCFAALGGTASGPAASKVRGRARS